MISTLRQRFQPQDRDLGLKARIWASRLRYGSGGGGGVKEEEGIKKTFQNVFFFTKYIVNVYCRRNFTVKMHKTSNYHNFGQQPQRADVL